MNREPTPYEAGISEDPRDTWADAGQAERARADAIRQADAETGGWRARGPSARYAGARPKPEPETEAEP